MASKNEWERWNNDSLSHKWRAKHVAANGGEFVKDHKGWDWVAPVAKKKASAPTPPAVAKPTTKKTTKKKGKRL
jgi:hypothetical protein|tara:strand:+ start:359 stop:580 length:222 start_codon:yes stop_codon:yes gene_type:complete